MKTTLTTSVLLLLCLVSTLHAQNVTLEPKTISSAGGRISSPNLDLDWNIGEISTTTVTAASTLYTQGFEQPQIKENVNIDAPTKGDNEWTLYPNPTTTHIVLHSEQANFVAQTAVIFDEKGSEVMRVNITENDMPINISHFADATYLLTLLSKEQKITRTFKIIKTH